MGNDPPWLGEAQGGLVATGLLTLLPFWWANRSRWIGWLAGCVWLGLAGLTVYYTVRGWVPAFLNLTPPMWMPLLAGLVLGAGALWILLHPLATSPDSSSAVEAPEQPRRPSDEGKPSPDGVRPEDLGRIAAALTWTPTEYPSLWRSLRELEREVLQEIWRQRDGFMTHAHAEQRFLSQIGRDVWNATTHVLLEHGLVEQVTVVRRSRFRTTPWPPGGWRLTKLGKAVLTWKTRQEQFEREAATQSSVASASADGAHAGRWASLSSLEQKVLVLAWRQQDGVLPWDVVEAIRGEVGEAHWNSLAHTLEKRELLYQSPDGFTLSDGAKDLMHWHTMQHTPKAE